MYLAIMKTIVSIGILAVAVAISIYLRKESVSFIEAFTLLMVLNVYFNQKEED